MARAPQGGPEQRCCWQVHDSALASLPMTTLKQEESLGGRIARLRSSKGWNQKELAAKVDVKPAQISKYERGVYDPSLSILIRLASALGTSTDHLLTGKEAPRVEPDRLTVLWPALKRLPLDLRNEIAGALENVIKSQFLLGLGGLSRK